MTSKTPNLNLNLPNFNTSPWHDELNTNFRAIDAVIVSIFGLTTLLGPYKNSTAVSAGQRYFDENTGFYYEALSDFTTMAFPNTFAEERIAHPARWALLDASKALDAAANALVSELAARASQVVAQTSAAEATTSASAATTSAANASTAATSASTSAATASTAATSASTAATTAVTNANASAVNANAAAASALQAAANAIALLPETIASDTTGNAATATNAAQLGGILATNYARTDIAETFNSTITASGNITGNILIANGGLVQVQAANSTGNSALNLTDETGALQGVVLWQRIGDNIRIRNSSAGTASDLVGNATGGWNIGANAIWHAGNDGANSGLDADLLDGVQGVDYARSARTLTGSLGISGGGSLTANRTFSLAFNNLPEHTSIADDEFVILNHASGTGNDPAKMTMENFRNAINGPLDTFGPLDTSDPLITDYPLGTTVTALLGNADLNLPINTEIAIFIGVNTTFFLTVAYSHQTGLQGSARLLGTWRRRGQALMMRTA